MTLHTFIMASHVYRPLLSPLAFMRRRAAPSPVSFLQASDRVKLSKGALRKLHAQISDVLLSERASRAEAEAAAAANAGASLAETESGATAEGQAQAQSETQARAGDAGLNLDTVLNPNPTTWWPGRTAMAQALNEQGSTITGMSNTPEPASNNPGDAALLPGGSAGLWWLKSAPWFLPPPPEWGPIKPEMYATYYYKPVHRNYMLPNVQQREAPWYAPNTDADGTASKAGASAGLVPGAGATELPPAFAGSAGARMSMFAAGAAAPGASGLGAVPGGAGGLGGFGGGNPGAAGGQPSGPIGSGTDGVHNPPFRGVYASDLNEPLPPETQVGPSPSLTAEAFAAGAPGSDGRPYAGPTSTSAPEPPLALTPGGVYAVTGNQLISGDRAGPESPYAGALDALDSDGSPQHSGLYNGPLAVLQGAVAGGGAPQTPPVPGAFANAEAESRLAQSIDPNAVDPLAGIYSAPAGSLFPAAPVVNLAHGAVNSMGSVTAPLSLTDKTSAPTLMQGGAVLGGPDGNTKTAWMGYRDSAAYLMNGPGSMVGIGPRAPPELTALNGMVGAPAIGPGGHRCSPFTPGACNSGGLPAPGEINLGVSRGGSSDYPGLAPMLEHDPTKDLFDTGLSG